ncbi:MAG: tRNA (adenosine(37)-N6)-dimethylallyltransferase MiaA [Candidatus Berkiellales bacterium]
MGPTASGKTDLAIALVRHFPVEIINVDSAQIYRNMDIGSGKPSLETRQTVTHHLMDILDPPQSYSAAQFRQEALILIADIVKRNKIPLCVGGTMLYFKALQQGLSVLPTSDPTLRAQLDEAMAREGLAVHYERLMAMDPLTAKRLQPKDRQRIQRALEIYALTHQPMSYWLGQKIDETMPYHFINIALMPIETPRSLLHQRIEKRFDEMLQNGLVEEVEKLLQNHQLNVSCPALKAVGYRQVAQYLLGNLSFEAMREKAIASTRQLAKRQLTWLRHWPNLIAFDFMDQHLQSKVIAYLESI